MNFGHLPQKLILCRREKSSLRLQREYLQQCKIRIEDGKGIKTAKKSQQTEERGRKTRDAGHKSSAYAGGTGGKGGKAEICGL